MKREYTSICVGHGCYMNCIGCIYIRGLNKEQIQRLVNKGILDINKHWTSKYIEKEEKEIVRSISLTKSRIKNGHAEKAIISYNGEISGFSTSHLHKVFSLLRNGWNWEYPLVVLTKNPKMLLRKLNPETIEIINKIPRNLIFAVSISRESELRKIEYLRKLPGNEKQVWFLPLLEKIDSTMINLSGINLVDVGGFIGENPTPDRYFDEWFDEIEKACRKQGISCRYKHASGYREKDSKKERYTVDVRELIIEFKLLLENSRLEKEKITKHNKNKEIVRLSNEEWQF